MGEGAERAPSTTALLRPSGFSLQHSNQSWGVAGRQGICSTCPQGTKGTGPSKTPQGGWQDEGQTRETLVSRS